MQQHQENNQPYYGNIPLHEPGVFPWITSHVELVGPCKVQFKTTYSTKTKKYILALTILDSVTFYTEIVYIKYKPSANIRSILKIIKHADTQVLPYCSMIMELSLQVDHLKAYLTLMGLNPSLILWKTQELIKFCK